MSSDSLAHAAIRARHQTRPIPIQEDLMTTIKAAHVRKGTTIELASGAKARVSRTEKNRITGQVMIVAGKHVLALYPDQPVRVPII